MNKFGLSFIFILLASFRALAQPYCHVKTFNLRDGLASNTITGLTQTPDQLLWCSTWNGLTCYDGYRFTNYIDQTQQRRLTTNRMLSIQPSQTGNVWCVTYDRRPYLFERRRSQFVDMSDIIKQRYGEDLHVNWALSMTNGHTWLISSDKGGGTYRVTDHDYDREDGIIKIEPTKMGEVFLAAEDGDGDEWIFYEHGTSLLGADYSTALPFRFIAQVGKKVYLATPDGKLGCYDKQRRQASAIKPRATLHHISRLMNCCDRWLVAAADEGLLIHDTRNGAQRLVATPGGIDPQSLTADSSNRLWAVLKSGDEVVCITLTDGTLSKIPASRPAAWPNLGAAAIIHEDRNKTIWLATHSGFFGYYDEQQHQLKAYPLHSTPDQPAANQWMADAQGNIWYAGDHKLAMVAPQYQHIHHITDLKEVRSVMFDREGNLWTGSAEGYIAIIKGGWSQETGGGQHMEWLGPDGKRHAQPVRFSSRIYALFQDHEGNIWIGTKGDGLYRLTPNGQLSHFLHDQNDKWSLPSNQIYAIHQDHQQRIWLGTFEQGIALVQESGDRRPKTAGKPRFLHGRNVLTGYPIDEFNKVRRITETTRGEIIVSASNGLVIFSEHFSDPALLNCYGHKHVAGDSTSLMTDDVMQTLITSEDSIFVATVGGGLQMIRDKERLKDKLRFHTVRRLFSDNGIIMGMVQDHRQNLWISRENSINMFEHANHRLWHLGPNIIGENTELTEAQPAINPLTGQLAFATSDGIICFQPDRLDEAQFTPPLVFTGVLLHGNQDAQQMVTDSTLEINADERNLTILFAALDYNDNSMIRYAYKLEGVDRDWNQLGTEHSISFSNFPPGHHRLLIRSTNSYGAWVNNVATLHVYAHPTFWETWWAKLLYLLLFAGMVGIAVWIYKLRTKATMEHQLNEMKTQFFTDVSHKLRTPLTLIGGPVRQVLQAGGLSETAQHHLEMVERNAHRMLELVNKMLTYSKEHHTYISDETDFDTVNAPSESASPSENLSPLTSHLSPQKTRLLIVEDNDDLRTFLASILEDDYQVMLATNGREGLEMARQELPDFILTDVMMPEMDGLTMVHHIKEDKDISHIPIVILSAKASMDDRLEGLRAGVHDYITKPFSATYLKQRMQNIIANQRMLQQNYLAQLKPAEPTLEQPLSSAVGDANTPDDDETHTIRLTATTIVDSDKEMMERLLAYIDENISNPDLKIEDLASAVCLGRTVFYNKVKSLVGMSPVELLRHIRIQRAEDMVAQSSEPFSQIAYALGFSDSRYFGRCFKKQTGLTPSEYREMKSE